MPLKLQSIEFDRQAFNKTNTKPPPKSTCFLMVVAWKIYLLKKVALYFISNMRKEFFNAFPCMWEGKTNHEVKFNR